MTDPAVMQRIRERIVDYLVLDEYVEKLTYLRPTEIDNIVYTAWFAEEFEQEWLKDVIRQFENIRLSERGKARIGMHDIARLHPVGDEGKRRGLWPWGKR